MTTPHRPNIDPDAAPIVSSLNTVAEAVARLRGEVQASKYDQTLLPLDIRPSPPTGGAIAADPENEKAVSALAQRLSQNPDLVPFVGAGLSRPYGYPSWAGLIAAGAALAGMDNPLGQGDDADYEAAMTKVSDGLGALAYQEFLYDAFSPKAAPEDTRFAAAEFLPYLHQGPVVTTNVDRVLETVFADSGKPLDVVIGAGKDRIRNAIDLRQRCLIKLHGDYRDERYRILTEDEYDKHYGAATRAGRRTRPFAELVERLLGGSSFLFLGFGMENRTQNLLEAIARSPVRSHWMVLEKPTSKVKQAATRTRLSNLYVRPLWYESSGRSEAEKYNDISDLLHWIIYSESASTSDVRRFYSHLTSGRLGKAVRLGSSLNRESIDPITIWNCQVAAEVLARAMLAKGSTWDAIDLLDTQLQSGSTIESVRLLHESLRVVLGQSDSLDMDATRFWRSVDAAIPQSLAKLRAHLMSSAGNLVGLVSPSDAATPPHCVPGDADPSVDIHACSALVGALPTAIARLCREASDAAAADAIEADRVAALPGRKPTKWFRASVAAVRRHNVQKGTRNAADAVVAYETARRVPVMSNWRALSLQSRAPSAIPAQSKREAKHSAISLMPLELDEAAAARAPDV